MIKLAGFYLLGHDTFESASSVLQLPVNDCQQHSRSTTGYRLAETFLGSNLAVLRIDGYFLRSCRPRRYCRIFHLDVRTLSDELIGSFLLRLLAYGGLLPKELLSLCHEFLTTLGKHETTALLERTVFVVRIRIRSPVGTINRTVHTPQSRFDVLASRSQLFDDGQIGRASCRERVSFMV